jgi:histidyl-tRNA synthetase
MFKRVPGTRDILPEETNSWQRIEDIARKIFLAYNYQEIRPPILEKAGLFSRSLGTSTEIIQKQMFLTGTNLAPTLHAGTNLEVTPVAQDTESKDLYALRPEGTASVVRAYIENNLDKTAGFSKFYYLGAMFRAERPQKGRLRQFHHLGAEAIGSIDARLDVELISLVDTLLKGLDIQNYKIKINSLGCPKDKKALSELLRKELKDKIQQLCPDCQRRFETNVMRILDCKNEGCRQIAQKLDLGERHLCLECKTHFLTLQEGLVSLGINFEVDALLVRGLDYYTRTVFEIIHPQLGAQDAIGAGGRYDNLVSDLGGPELGAIGFALGIERLLLVSKSRGYLVSNKKLAYVVALGQEAQKESLKLLHTLRKAGISADTDYENKSLKGAMRRADDLGATCVIIIGENELQKKVVLLKDMASGEQKEIRFEDIITQLK